jgi:hypothetical protein
LGLHSIAITNHSLPITETSMNIDIPLTDQAVSSTTGMATSAITAGAEPPLDEFARLHRVALVLLQLPAIPPRVLQWFTAMPIRALQWIWNEADPRQETEPLDHVEAFARACTLLSIMPIESAELTCADVVNRLDRLLAMLRYSWRFVPPGLLAKMLLVLPPSVPADRLLQLQLQHVAEWAATRNQKMSSAPRRDWNVFVRAAMKWHHHGEIALRMHPRTWVHPLANLRVNGFVLTPVSCTAQMVDAQGHQGTLCSSKVADACERGEEAWWLVRSALGVPSPAGCTPVDAAVSLLADADGSWRVGPMLAPPHCVQAAVRVGRSLAAQAEVDQRLQRIGRVALLQGNQLPGVHDTLVALLVQQTGTSPPSSVP